MGITEVRQGVVSLLGIVILAAAISVAGCASHSHSEVLPNDAAKVLSVGDKVEITRHDGSKASLTITAVEDDAVIGGEVGVPMNDIAAITLYVRDDSSSDFDSNAFWEIFGWLSAIVIWSAILG